MIFPTSITYQIVLKKLIWTNPLFFKVFPHFLKVTRSNFFFYRRAIIKSTTNDISLQSFCISFCSSTEEILHRWLSKYRYLSFFLLIQIISLIITKASKITRDFVITHNHPQKELFHYFFLFLFFLSRYNNFFLQKSKRHFFPYLYILPFFLLLHSFLFTSTFLCLFFFLQQK